MNSTLPIAPKKSLEDSEAVAQNTTTDILKD
jgi:hypothetical protein